MPSNSAIAWIANMHLFRSYPEAKFGGYTDVDGTIAFYLRVNSLLGEESTVLDVGCGRGAYSEDTVPVRRRLRILSARCRVIGLDVSSDAAENPFIHEFRLILPGTRWPIDDESVDLVLADFVLEHVERPDLFFAEASRVLKPGGYICIRTPNLYSYVGLATRLIPNRLHKRLVKTMQVGRAGVDVFDTYHRCNSVGRLERAFRKHGLPGVVYGYESEPRYLEFSRGAYLLGVLYQRLAPRSVASTIFGFGRKSEPAVDGEKPVAEARNAESDLD